MARIYTLSKGASLTDEILGIARREKIRTGRVEAIGTVNKLKIAFFDHESKTYEEHEYEEQLEVTGMIGNITLKDGLPFLHLHGTFGRRDMSVIGGHIISATVFVLELVVTPTENTATRRFNKGLGLNTIYKVEN